MSDYRERAREFLHREDYASTRKFFIGDWSKPEAVNVLAAEFARIAQEAEARGYERGAHEMREAVESVACDIESAAKGLPLGARSARRTFLSACPAYDVEMFRVETILAAIPDALPLPAASAEQPDLRALLAQAASALEGIIQSSGCPFCDNGVLRKRVDGGPPFHAEDCDYAVAGDALAALRAAKVIE